MINTDIRKLLQEVLSQASVQASAPCRIDMSGTLDLSTFYIPLRHHQPCTINIALDLHTQVCLRAYQSGKIKVCSRGFESVEVASDQAPFAHPLGLMMAVAAYFQADGVQIDIDSASPPRSALGGSSVATVALIWAFAKALAKVGHPMPSRENTAILAHRIEQSVTGIPCGMQDQLAAAFGGVHAWHWNADPADAVFRREQLIAATNFPDIEQRLLVAYCGRPHISKDVNQTWVRQFVSGQYRSQWMEIAQYSHQFAQNLSRGEYGQALTLMNQETDLRCQMTPDVLDALGKQLVAAARRHDCGARFTGAGGGGCVWALGEPDQIIALRSVWQTLLSKHKEAKILDASIDVDGLL